MTDVALEEYAKNEDYRGAIYYTLGALDEIVKYDQPNMTDALRRFHAELRKALVKE